MTMPAMAKIAATICRDKERQTEERQGSERRSTGRSQCGAAHGPPLNYSLQNSQASQDKVCNGVITARD